MARAPIDFEAALRLLVEHGLEFIVVGGSPRQRTAPRASPATWTLRDIGDAIFWLKESEEASPIERAPSSLREQRLDR